MNQEDTKSCKKCSTLLTIIITAIVVGGGAYLWQNKKQEIKVPEIPEIKITTTEEKEAMTTKPSVKEISFKEYFNTRANYSIKDPALKDKILTVNNIIDPCEAVSDGPCGFDLYILASKDWEAKKNNIQTFFLEDQSATMPQYYGPFEDNLERIVDEAKKESIEELEVKKSFKEYVDERMSFKVSTPTNIVKIHTAKEVINPCTPSSDGPCGFDIDIYASSDWKSRIASKQIFYLVEQEQIGEQYYGPFEDNLERIVDEAK